MPGSLTPSRLGLVYNYEGELLHSAAIYDQDQFLNDLLTTGENGTVDSIDKFGRTPLHTAAFHGSIKCVKVLLQKGADPNAISGIEDQCSTPVHHAAKEGRLACLRELLDYEVNLDLKNSRGKKAIDVAYAEGRSDCTKCGDYIKKVAALYDVIDDGEFGTVKRILESLADPDSVINRYFRGPNTLLYRACLNGHLSITKLLIDYGADGRPNAESGLTPLYAACVMGHLDVVKYLSNKFPKHLIMPAASDESYPIHAAIMKNRNEVLRFLLTLRGTTKMNVNIREEHRRRSEQEIRKPMTMKSRSATLPEFPADCAELYNVDVNQTMKSGYTPIHLAVLCSSYEIVETLVTNCPIHNRSSLEEPLPGSLEIDKLAHFKTAFHHALILQKTDVADLLLRHGADVNFEFDDGDTPLQYVCKNSMEELLELLLEHGATDTGNKARIDAEESHRDNINQILLNQYVSTDEDGKIALAASEISLKLKPVSIQWSNKNIKNLQQEWLLNAGIYWNSEASEKLKIDEGLNLKLFTSIDLSHNDIITLPVILFQLPSLRCLNLSHNKIKLLPGDDESIQTNRTSRNIEELFMDQSLTENWNCPSLVEINLQHNLLTTLPRLIFHMPSLTTVNCGHNKITHVPFDIWTSNSLKTLILDHNQLKSLTIIQGPRSKTRKAQMAKDKKKGLKTQGTTKAPPVQPDNSRRQAVTAPAPQIYSKRPSWDIDTDESDDEDVEFVMKSGINKLDLSHNQFTQIPVGLPCLAPNLSKLNLANNKIFEVASVSLFPQSLFSLHLSYNGIKFVDFNVELNRTDLCCYGIARTRNNKRNSSTSGKRRLCTHIRHQMLPSLTNLYLDHNQLEQVNFTFLSKSSKRTQKKVLCPELKTLQLEDNKLSKLPTGIGSLTKLQTLSISNNTNIESLTPELGLCKELYNLSLKHVSIKDPPRNIMETGDVKRIVRYLKSLHDKAQAYPNFKLMVVGIHGIGKSTLLEALRKEGTGSFQQAAYQATFSERRVNEKAPSSNQQNQSTVGVDISDWSYSRKKTNGPVIKFSTWDFAGQTEYYATHQCFLSRRALYLLLWKLTDGEKGINEMEQWLLNIQTRAPNASVIIVGTFLDEIDRRYRDKYVQKMHSIIRTRFMACKYNGGVPVLEEKGLPKVVGLLEVSCKTNVNINTLRDLIYDTVTKMKGEGTDSKTLLVEKPIPASYIQVEKAVAAIAENLQNEMPVLEEPQFRRLVNDQLTAQGVELRNGNQELDEAVQFLHDYGALLHYDDPSLKELYFLDPQWLCDMLAHIVTVRSVNPCIKNGLLKISDLQNQIFHGEKRFPSSHVMKYADLMSKFEVGIKISDKYLLIPSLLPDKQKQCPVVADHEFPELRKAMNVHAYLNHRVYRRLYLMTYVPSGFWARLLTRLIADDRICKIVSSCCEIQGSVPGSAQAKQDSKTLMRAALPEWACWKTGIELSCFGAKLLRVCQLDPGCHFYGADENSPKVFVKRPNMQEGKIGVEILAPSITLTIEKFIHYRPTDKDQDEENNNLVGFRVVNVSDKSSRAACQILVLAVEHIDNLFGEWFTKLDDYINIQGVKAIQRVSYCQPCLLEAIRNLQPNLNSNVQSDNLESSSFGGGYAENNERNVFAPDINDSPNQTVHSGSLDENGENDSLSSPRSIFEEDDRGDSSGLGHDADDGGGNGDDPYKDLNIDEDEKEILRDYRENANGKIIAFELEEASKLLRKSRDLICPFHLSVDFKDSFPDLCFLDLDESLLLDSRDVKKEKQLGKGAFGVVHRSIINNGGFGRPAAMKTPLKSGSENRNDEVMATHISYDTYKAIRQELAILIPLNHENIVKLLGVIVSPFAMLLELADGGSLDNYYKMYQKEDKKINPYVVQVALQQISAGLKYLHEHHIIYRDLKCDNVLVCSFPKPNVVDYMNANIKLKLTDYGISRAVAISGTKGFQGTPGFMAPEIIKYSGKETYNAKVDCFSLGSLIYELIARKQPYHEEAKNRGAVAFRYMASGNRPHLKSKEKCYPVLIISLMNRCWAQKSDDRPSSTEINGLTMLPEFSKLLDINGLSESFSLHCAVTINDSHSNVPDSRSVIGSKMWFCGHQGFGDMVSTRNEGCATIFSYDDNKYNLQADLKFKERVSKVCSVGSMIWVGTYTGNIKVYCTLTYKPVALGRLSYQRYILQMVHSPICNSVFVSLEDGSILCYHDNISDESIYPRSVPEHELSEYFLNVKSFPKVAELNPINDYMSDTSVHCLAAVPSFAVRKYSQAVFKFKNASGDGIAVAVDALGDKEDISEEVTEDPSKVNYELWCGEEKGRITVLDLKTLKKMKTLPVSGDDITNPALSLLCVSFMEISRTYEQFNNNNNNRTTNNNGGAKLTNYIWIVVFPGSVISRWNVSTRSIEKSFNASKHAPNHDSSDAKISSLAIIENKMYVGTSFGCLLICDAMAMDVLSSVRCYEELIDIIIPLRMIASRHYEYNRKLVISGGRKCLDYWARKLVKKKGIASMEMTILTWSHSQ